MLAELVLDYRRSSSRRGLLRERLGGATHIASAAFCGCHAQLVWSARRSFSQVVSRLSRRLVSWLSYRRLKSAASPLGMAVERRNECHLDFASGL